MNNRRRKKMSCIIKELEQCVGELNDIKDEEDSSRDNIPENLQESSTFLFSEQCSEMLDDAISDIESTIRTLEEI